jgi:hypothetical protein
VDNSNVEVDFSGFGNNLVPYTPCFLCPNTNFVFEIKRQIPNSPDFLLVYRSESRNNDGVNPKWKKSKFKAGKLCGGDMSLPIKVQVKVESEGQFYEQGEFTTNMTDLTTGKHSFNVQGAGSKEMGSFTFGNFNIVEKPSMVDFLRTGW